MEPFKMFITTKYFTQL